MGMLLHGRDVLCQCSKLVDTLGFVNLQVLPFTSLASSLFSQELRCRHP